MEGSIETKFNNIIQTMVSREIKKNSDNASQLVYHYT